MNTITHKIYTDSHTELVLHHGPASAPSRTTRAPLALIGFRVFHGLVDWEYETGGLASGGESIYLDYGRLPHAAQVVIGYILCRYVHAIPQSRCIR